jgi:hypothetical protein
VFVCSERATEIPITQKSGHRTSPKAGNRGDNYRPYVNEADLQLWRFEVASHHDPAMQVRT